MNCIEALPSKSAISVPAFCAAFFYLHATPFRILEKFIPRFSQLCDGESFGPMASVKNPCAAGIDQYPALALILRFPWTEAWSFDD
jgi:hypothetical protein